MGYYISPTVGYYEGDQIEGTDAVVSRRPDATYTWDGQAWQPTSATTNAPIYAQIAALETTVTERRVREAVLGIDGGWLKALNDQITALRGTLVK